jgi:hypothetical protein
VAAGLLVARAEAGAAAQAASGGEALSEADKYKAALLLAVREKQVGTGRGACDCIQVYALLEHLLCRCML